MKVQDVHYVHNIFKLRLINGGTIDIVDGEGMLAASPENDLA